MDNSAGTRLEKAIYKHAGTIKTAKGYSGMAVTNSEGKILASDIPDSSILDFQSMAEAVNIIHTECSKNLNRRGLGGCHGLSLNTDYGVVTMYTTDPYKGGNYRFLVIVAEEGNSFFVQTQLRAVIPKILADM